MKKQNKILISAGAFWYSCNESTKKKKCHVPILSVENKTVSNQMSWHCLPCSECLSLLDSAVTLGSEQTFWYLFCPFGHLTTSSMFECEYFNLISCSAHLFIIVIFNDKKPKSLADGRFPGVFFVFSEC